MTQGRSIPVRTERMPLISFDGGVSETAVCQRPDRYRLVQANLGDGARIARGGGYSYAAASFGAGSIVQDMRRFNRCLRFDPLARVIEVEAGMTLGELLALTSRSGLSLPVQPGYPAITIGGCVAANVHGKNPLCEGTFRGSVLGLALFHPDYGILNVTPDDPPGVFDLTCGGYGLTGVILAVSLRLDPLVGHRVSIRRIGVGDPIEAIAVARNLAAESLFAYTWHDAVPSGRTFGRGFVYQGLPVAASDCPNGVVPQYRILTAEARARWPFSLWGPLSTRAFTSMFWQVERRRPELTQTTLFDAIFPFARRSAYFRLFGQRGLLECQLLIPSDRTEAVLHELRRLILSTRAQSVMLSLKAFGGTQRFLRFEGEGTCVTLDLLRSDVSLAFLERLDDLTIAVGGIPNIIKDSRLPQSVVQSCYPEYEHFRHALRIFDKKRLFKSEVSERLDL
jgi:decaprenylphospho-beta-D-ribofuranose 2-oxidase